MSGNVIKDPEEMSLDELRAEISMRRHALDTPGFFYRPEFKHLGDDRENVRMAFYYRLQALEAEVEEREWPSQIPG